MSERDKGPKPRVKRFLQSPIGEEEIWSGDRYVDHDLDLIFEAAERDTERPEGTHVGWWAFESELTSRPRQAGEVIMDLPFRYPERLDTPASLESILSRTIPSENEIFLLKMGYLGKAKDVIENFSRWTPEETLRDRFFEHLGSVGEVIPQYERRLRGQNS